MCCRRLERLPRDEAGILSRRVRQGAAATPTWTAPTPMLRGFRRFARAGILLREIKGIRTDLQTLTQTLARIASTLEAQYPSAPSPVTSPDDSVEVAYVDDAMQAELMEIELRLAQATGQPPNEYQVMAEYERVHDLEQGTFGGMS